MTSPPAVRLEPTDPADPRAVAAVAAYLAEVDVASTDGYRPTAGQLDPFRGPSGTGSGATDESGASAGSEPA